jgi:hypothetical protein
VALASVRPGSRCSGRLRGGVVHELFKDPLEVSERIGAVAADLFYEGVDDRAAPACVLAADEHPVLVPELGWASGFFGEVVVEADDAPGEFAEAVMGFAGFDPAGALAVERVGVLFVHPLFDLIDHADVQEDVCGDARVFAAGFLELAGDVGEAGDGGDGELAQQGGEQSDLIGIRGTGDGTARQVDFQGGGGGLRGDLGNEECVRSGRI